MSNPAPALERKYTERPSGAHQGLGEEHVFEDTMQLVDLVREGIPTPSTPEHARHVIEIIEAGYRAAETGQTQNLTTTFDLT